MCGKMMNEVGVIRGREAIEGKQRILCGSGWGKGALEGWM